jgi:hypothetical protein
MTSKGFRVRVIDVTMEVLTRPARAGLGLQSSGICAMRRIRLKIARFVWDGVGRGSLGIQNSELALSLY